MASPESSSIPCPWCWQRVPVATEETAPGTRASPEITVTCDNCGQTFTAQLFVWTVNNKKPKKPKVAQNG